MRNFLTSLSLLTLFITSSVFISCSSDDNSSTDPIQIEKNPLLGKWTGDKIDLKIEVDGNIQIDEKETDITNELELYFEFKEDNIIRLYQKELETGEVVDGTGTYTVSGSELTINISGIPQTFQYNVISDTKLNLTLITEEVIQDKVLKMEMTYHLVK